MSWNVRATCRFWGQPGQEKRAAEAWAFELKYYFLRRVGEQPVVSYEPMGAGGVYTVTGLMSTSHPSDDGPGDVVFSANARPWDLDYVCEPQRRKFLMENYPGPTWG